MALASMITIPFGILLALLGFLKTIHDVKLGKFPGIELQVLLAGILLAFSVPGGGWAADWALPRIPESIPLASLPDNALHWAGTGIIWFICLVLLPSWREIQEEYAMERGAGLFQSLRGPF